VQEQAGDAAAGKRLFTGETQLANGGPACMSCHSIAGAGALGGGRVGPDLTGVYTKLGETPLVSACEKTNFKIMSAAYKDHPVTKREALHLTKFFAAVGEAPAPLADPPVAAYGAAAALVCLGALAFAYRKRAPGVRRSLVRRRHDVVD
jgi:cytochrome c2